MLETEIKKLAKSYQNEFNSIKGSIPIEIKLE